METTESILTSVKKLLGIDESYTHFDPDLIMHINSVFSILDRLASGRPTVSPSPAKAKRGLISSGRTLIAFHW